MRTPRTITGTLLLLGLLLAAGPIAYAQPTTTTTLFKNTTISYPGVSLCNPANTGIVTFTFNGVLHTTLLDSGAYHLAGEMVGQIVAVPDDPAYPTFTGRLVQRYGPDTPVNLNLRNQTATYTAMVHLIGSNGSTEQFTYLEHLTLNANGEVAVSLSALHGLRCG